MIQISLRKIWVKINLYDDVTIDCATSIGRFYFTSHLFCSQLALAVDFNANLKYDSPYYRLHRTWSCHTRNFRLSKENLSKKHILNQHRHRFATTCPNWCSLTHAPQSSFSFIHETENYDNHL